MEAAEFKARLRILGRTQVDFALETGKSLRAIHYWASHGPPSEVVYLLDLLTAWELPFGPAAGRDDEVGFARAIENQLDRLLALAAPSQRAEFLRYVAIWSEHHRLSQSGHCSHPSPPIAGAERLKEI